jgi:hypothetical protein
MRKKTLPFDPKENWRAWKLERAKGWMQFLPDDGDKKRPRAWPRLIGGESSAGIFATAYGAV